MLGEALSQAFASADIFVMPSESETLGFVAMEAMASGIPVVSVAAGGLTNIIQHNITGFLSKPDSAMIEFSENVKLLIEDSSLRSRIGIAARRQAMCWSWYNATKILREKQYSAAIQLHKLRPKGWWFRRWFTKRNLTVENQIMNELKL